MRISVVVPVLNEQEGIASTLDVLAHLAPAELIVVDGGSTDATLEMVGRSGAVLVCSRPGRAEQMNRGAAAAKGEVLLFVHADTRLPPGSLEEIAGALEDPRVVGGRFDLTLDGPGWVFKMIGFLISLRSRLTKVATGDQAIFVRREVFEKIGGYPAIPIMEDIAFSRALKKEGRIACLRIRVVTSSRRWEREGVWRTVLRMWWLRMLFLLGVSPVRLKRFYADAR